MTDTVSDAPDDEATDRDVRAKAMDYLARRDYSVYELATKLKQRGFNATLVERAVDVLAADGSVDDRRYTESLTRSRIHRGYGPLRIRQELERQHVASEIVAEFVDRDDEFWLSHLYRVYRRKYGESSAEDPKERARQIRFLASRGFTHEQIKRLQRSDNIAEFDTDAEF